MHRTVLRFGPYVLDEADETLWRDGSRVPLAPKCFAILRHLVNRPGTLVTKDELLDAVWPDAHVADGVLKVRVREVRAALGDDAGTPRFIGTVHRRGYRFVAPVRAEPAGDAAPARTPAPAARGPIGRHAELTRLRERFERACAGERQVVFVTGEAGIGKTALVDAFTATLPPPTLVARGQCLEHYGGGEAYLPVLDAVGELTRGGRAERVVRVLRELAPTWLVQLPWLLTTADRAVLQRELLGTTRERMLREMAEAFETLADDQPLVVVLEDLHWSDPSTLDLLAMVAHRRRPARLQVVATYRPVDVILASHPLRSLKLRLEQQRLCAELPLPYLGTGDVAAYLGRRLSARALPPGLAEAVVERTAGNPLFVVTLVDHLLERGWPGGGEPLDTSLARVRAEVPDGLRDMIERQLERLPPEDAQVLEAASAVGEEFSVAAVAAATEAAPRFVETVCESEAARGQLVRALGTATLAGGAVSGRYAFAHALHRDVLYRRLPAARRLAVHRRLGGWMASAGATPAEVARHFVAAAPAGCGAEAVAWSVRAAERAGRLLAHAEAARHYRTALDLRSTQPDAAADERCRLTLALGHAEERSGALAAAVETLAEAAELARAAGAPALLAEAALGVRHHAVVGTDARRVALLEEALAGLPAGDGPLRARVMARLDAALSPLPGTHDRREALRRDAMAMARRLGDADALLFVLLYTRWAFIGAERPRELRALVAELDAVAARVREREQVLHAHLLRVAMLGELGEVAAATHALDVFTRLAEEAGIPWFRWFAVRVRAGHALQAGRFDEAERLVDEALAIGERMEHPNARPVAGAQLRGLRLLQGRFAEVEPRLARHVGQYPADHLSRAALAWLHAHAGDGTAAARELDTLAADGFATVPRDSVWLMCLAYAAETCARLRDRARAAGLYDLLAPHADRVLGVGPNLFSMGHGARYVGLLAATLGRWDEAARLLDAAIAAHERMGARPWLAWSLRDRATLLERAPRRGRAAQRADAAWDGALGLARALGMRALERDVVGRGGSAVGRGRK